MAKVTNLTNYKKRIDKSLRKTDNWINVLTNLGVQDKDKRTGAQVQTIFQSETQLEALYQADDISARIIDRIPEEMTREGFEILIPGDENPEIVEFATAEMDRLQVKAKYRQALKFARLYGGARRS